MSLMQMSFSGAVIILVIIAIRTLFIHQLPKSAFMILWAIALLRLLLPFSLPSVFSIYSIIPQHALDIQTTVTEQTPVFPVNIIPTVPSEETPAIDAFPDVSSGQSHSGNTSVLFFMILWAAGAVLCGIYFTVSYFHCSKEFKTSLPVSNEFLKCWLIEHPSKRKITVRQSDCIASPLTYGILHPVILLPKKTNWKDVQQIEYILTHEYIHIRRFDAVTKLLLISALCLHWFNPIAWAMYYFYNRDMEIFCDETVLRILGKDARSAYAMTLIAIKESNNHLTPLYMNFSKNTIEERITAIMKFKKTSLGRILASLALILIIVIIAFTTSSFSEKKQLKSTPNIANGTADDNASLPNIANGTADDYASLLNLKTADYHNQTVADFNQSLQKWADEDLNRSLRIQHDIATKDIKVGLSDEDLSFVQMTFAASNSENAAQAYSNQIGNPNDCYILGSTSPVKEYGNSDNWYNLYYRISYHIEDDTKMTIGERDEYLLAVFDSVNMFWSSVSWDDLKISAFDLHANIAPYVGMKSNDKITFQLDYDDGDGIYFYFYQC